MLCIQAQEAQDLSHLTPLPLLFPSNLGTSPIDQTNVLRNAAGKKSCEKVCMVLFMAVGVDTKY